MKVRLVVPPGTAKVTEVVHVKGLVMANLVMRDGTPRTITLNPETIRATG